MKKVAEDKVPENVRETPADAEGNGFVQAGLDVSVGSLVGDDGIIYTRMKGEYFVDDEDAE